VVDFDFAVEERSVVGYAIVEVAAAAVAAFEVAAVDSTEEEDEEVEGENWSTLELAGSAVQAIVAPPVKVVLTVD
jgi:phage-related minor tail protein